MFNFCVEGTPSSYETHIYWRFEDPHGLCIVFKDGKHCPIKINITYTDGYLLPCNSKCWIPFYDQVEGKRGREIKRSHYESQNLLALMSIPIKHASNDERKIVKIIY